MQNYEDPAHFWGEIGHASYIFIILLLFIRSSDVKNFLRQGSKCFSIKLEVSIDDLHAVLSALCMLIFASATLCPCQTGFPNLDLYLFTFAVPFRRHYQKFLKATLGNNSTKS